jgi:hypothetical protein
MSKANGFIKIERALWHSPEVLALSTPAKVRWSHIVGQFGGLVKV